MTKDQRDILLASEVLGDYGRKALEAEQDRLTKERDALPHGGEEGLTARNGLNLVLWDIAARLAVPDPLPPADRAAVEARLAERRQRRATMESLRAELLTTSPGSERHEAIVNDITEFSRALSEEG